MLYKKLEHGKDKWEICKTIDEDINNTEEYLEKVLEKLEDAEFILNEKLRNKLVTIQFRAFNNDNGYCTISSIFKQHLNPNADIYKEINASIDETIEGVKDVITHWYNEVVKLVSLDCTYIEDEISVRDMYEFIVEICNTKQ